MAGLEVRAFNAPDETRRPDKTQVDVVKVGANTAARLTLAPGWKWSECIKPIVGTEDCQVRHVGVLAVRQDARAATTTARKARSVQARRTSSSLATMLGWWATSPWSASSSSRRQPRCSGRASVLSR